ncbi:hypothetical protein QJS10_CPB18g01544 [Acorus calamus]|uniref:C2 NT-type domain-containing protein n=1 Tax=Acorus calamus TaxID=4465 RepID=A0AAV9CRP2_ACOCL|nr:hypothetical protein QJS10_CPB18g01544 [Acorus calamus]
MFKAWRSEKNKIKAVFKFQFQATQVPLSGWDTLVVSLVPLEIGKPTARTGKAEVIERTCRWESPIYETVKLIKEPKSGKINEKTYQFFVSVGSPDARLLGEATIDLAEYAEAIKPSSVSLPLKAGAILHVTVQRMQDSVDGRGAVENGGAAVRSNGRSLRSQLSKYDELEGSKASNGIEDNNSDKMQDNITGRARLRSHDKRALSERHADHIVTLTPSRSFDVISASGSDSGSGRNTPREIGYKSNSMQRETMGFLSPLSMNSTPLQPASNGSVLAMDSRDHRRSNTECSVSSAPEDSTDGSTNSSEESAPKERLQSGSSIEKLKGEIVALSRQVEVSELELQTLRKQVMKESRRGQDLNRDLRNMEDERDALKRECEQLKASHKLTRDERVPNKLLIDGEDLRSMLEEIKKELNHEKNLNANLRLQLQKTQESNSELLLAVRDLDELLEQKNRELSQKSCNPSSMDLATNCDEQDLKSGVGGENSLQSRSKEELSVMTSIPEDDEEQCELDALIKERDDAKMMHSLEEKVMGLNNEIELYRKDRDDLEMQMEQLALDYEILKQENHETSLRLEQSQLREQLKMQYECSTHQSIINDLESHVESLEKELEKQADAFEADLTATIQAKVEQEQRAIRAEETLRKVKWNNANTVERVQEELNSLSLKMSSIFDANGKLAMEALTELHMQKAHLEELLKKSHEELALAQDKFEVRFKELADQAAMDTKQTAQLLCELDEKSKELEKQKTSQNALLEEMLILRDEIEVLSKEKSSLSELMIGQEEKWRTEIDQMRTAFEETKLMLQNSNAERVFLKKEVAVLEEEGERIQKEFNEIKLLKEEKDAAIETLKYEMAALRAQYNGLKQLLFEDKLEKEELKRQIFHLEGDIQKKDDTITVIEKKLKDSNARLTAPDGNTKLTAKSTKSSPGPRKTKEVADLREKIKLLEGEMKLKDAALEDSKHSFLMMEADFCNRIEELEKGIKEITQHGPSTCEDGDKEDAKDVEKKAASGGFFRDSTEATLLHHEITSTNRTDSDEPKVLNGYTSDHEDLSELRSELISLKERNKSMEDELKEMQERYSEISLKFAEVEGERQQLVMRVRNLKNLKKN